MLVRIVARSASSTKTTSSKSRARSWLSTPTASRVGLTNGATVYALLPRTKASRRPCVCSVVARACACNDDGISIVASAANARARRRQLAIAVDIDGIGRPCLDKERLLMGAAHRGNVYGRRACGHVEVGR